MVRNLSGGLGDIKNEWETLGSYSVPHPTLRGVRIISLNTVFFSNKYHAAQFSEGCAPVSSNGPQVAFTWLESNLEKARIAHEKVWLMFHIPPGIDPYSTVSQYQSLLKGGSAATGQLCTDAIVPMWVPSWITQFDSLLEKYHDTVVAAFAGHTHNDDFRLIGGKDTNRLFVLINPPISAIYNQNPAFRTIRFTRTGSLADASTYYLTNLTMASGTTRGEWVKEYTFSRQWHAMDINASSLGLIYEAVISQQKAREEWLKLYNVSSPAAQVPTGNIRGLYCAIEALDPESYKICYCPAEPAQDTVPTKAVQ
jgi:hypothetical protein